MSYAVGWDSRTNRFRGYGVPCYCDHPDCEAEIDRGIDNLCEDCGLAFCGDHGMWDQTCGRCYEEDPPFAPKPEHPQWVAHVVTDSTWEQWRADPDNRPLLRKWQGTEETK